MKNLLYIIALFFAVNVSAQQKIPVQVVPPTEFAKRMAAEKGQVIDVRTPKEFQAGHLENAVNIHLYDKDFSQRIDKLDKNKPVYVYCKVGGRSAEAVEIMQEKGFKKIVELEGGIDAWTDAKKLVKKP